MRIAWIALLVIGCGGGSKAIILDKPLGVPDMSEEKRDAATDALIAASAKHDPAAMAALLDTKVTYAGMWFSDTECGDLLAVTGTIQGEAASKLAACLAPLTFSKSPRVHPYANAAILTYEQGIEIEVMFDLQTSKLEWIGYAGQRIDADAVATVSQTALEALRAPESVTPLDASDLAALEAKEAWRKRLPDPGTFSAWFRLCVDSTGAITSVRPYEASSVVARDVFEKRVRLWRFKPVVLDGHPTPVCALVLAVHPESDDLKPRFPEPVPPEHADALVVPNMALPDQVAGHRAVAPPDEEKIAIRDHGNGRIGAYITLCLGDDGSVAWAQMSRSSGYPEYDARALRAVSTWRFATPSFQMCTRALFTYTQR